MQRAASFPGILLFVLLAAACSAATQNDGHFVFGREVPEEERVPIRAGVHAMLRWLEDSAEVRPREYTIEVHDDIGRVGSVVGIN